jgi:proteasome accessory factor B
MKARDTHWDKASTRILNLILALNATPRSFAWIRANVEGYTDGEEPTILRRLSRDLETVSDIGIEIVKVTAPSVSGSGDEERYVIDHAVSDLPDLELSAGEWEVLSLAAQWVPNPSLASTVRAALTKLVTQSPSSAPGPYAGRQGLAGRVSDAQDLSDTDINTLLLALNRNLALSFHYWTARTTEPTERHLDPWAVAAVGGKLYLTGYDRGRDAQRTFRLSRIADFEVGDDIIQHPAPDRPATELVREGLQSSSVLVTARVLFPYTEDGETRAQELRAYASDDAVSEDQDSSPESHPDGTVMSIGPVDRSWLVRQACAYAPDALVLSPPDLVNDVVARLTEARDKFGNGGTP